MMKLLSIILLIFLINSVYSQNLPLSCSGSREMYGVIGDNGMSVFDWEVTGGNIIRNYNDSILVEWDNENTVGEIKVKEINIYGCEGEFLSENVIISKPYINLEPEYEICQNDSIVLDVYNSDIIEYLWQDNSSDYNFVAYQEGSYWVKGMDVNGCYAYDTTNVIVNELPYIDLGNDTTLCEGDLYIDLSDKGVYYEWFDNSVSSSITIYPQDVTQEVWVNVTNEKGCISSDTIIVESCFNLIIPNTITPNGDGSNETWIIEGLYSYPNASISIYNRWGSMVYNTNNYSSSNVFDGRDKKGNKLPMDSYYYIIEIKNKEPIVGTLTIIR